jgi:hypothetical protein
MKYHRNPENSVNNDKQKTAFVVSQNQTNQTLLCVSGNFSIKFISKTNLSYYYLYIYRIVV